MPLPNRLSDAKMRAIGRKFINMKEHENIVLALQDECVNIGLTPEFVLSKIKNIIQKGKALDVVKAATLFFKITGILDASRHIKVELQAPPAAMTGDELNASIEDFQRKLPRVSKTPQLASSDDQAPA